jgi:hypothetical protein
VGIQESFKPQAASSKLMPTIVRGAIRLAPTTNPKPQAASLLDAAGRKVMGLLPGANDVRALAPGVYFVWEELQASSHKPQAVRKIVKLK